VSLLPTRLLCSSPRLVAHSHRSSSPLPRIIIFLELSGDVWPAPSLAHGGPSSPYHLPLFSDTLSFPFSTLFRSFSMHIRGLVFFSLPLYMRRDFRTSTPGPAPFPSYTLRIKWSAPRSLLSVLMLPPSFCLLYFCYDFLAEQLCFFAPCTFPLLLSFLPEAPKLLASKKLDLPVPTFSLPFFQLVMSPHPVRVFPTTGISTLSPPRGIHRFSGFPREEWGSRVLLLR